MTRRNVTDEQYGRLCRRTDELHRRVDEGTVNFNTTMDALQKILEGGQRLKPLKLIADNIAVKTDGFSKDSFFKNGPVKLYFWDSFRNQILKAIPDSIPAFEGALRKTQLTKSMLDSEILSELNNPQPFTVSEWAALICDLLSKQPNGENGQLLNNGYANIFYVKLEDRRVVAVSVNWLSDAREWYLDVYGLVVRWFGGRCVFSRS